MDRAGVVDLAATGSTLIVVEGRVQGVGFRPFVWRLAHAHRLCGWVRNDGGRVAIHIEGAATALSSFHNDLIERSPPLAQANVVEARAVAWQGYSAFAIYESADGRRTGALIPPDLFVCSECLAEMRDPGARRFRYPFINCTQCGPRYTIIHRLPYDRPNTSMADFALCPACRAEYEDPDDRRYHAQPLACSQCGPKVTLRRAPSEADHTNTNDDELHGEAALSAAVRCLKDGMIVAVKGVGGFHLLCDARSEIAVRRLRQRKRRPDKPLAVMVRARGTDDLDEVRAVSRPCAVAEQCLVDPIRPIVLVRRREGADLAPSIAPGLDEFGILLPYSPLHSILLDDFGGAVVATSGNRSGSPVETEEISACATLGNIADVFLVHDRPVCRPADDPVYRVVAGKARPLRLGRGNAPLQLRLPLRVARPILAVGGQIKSTVALAWDDRAVISPHIGDLASPQSQRAFAQIAAELQELFGVRAELIACDLHPDLSSTRWARRTGLPVMPVPHHYAHASALAGEHRRVGPLLVFAWDGVGLGEDGTLWGGEALLGGPGYWRRVGTLRPFRLPGGERASREPWRSALGLCWDAGMLWPSAPAKGHRLRAAWEQGLNAPVTSSAGRLFDAAAALLGLVQNTTYEAQGPMAMEAVATQGEPVSLPISQCGELIVADWVPLLASLLDADRSVGERSAMFHETLARVICSQAILVRKEADVACVGLTGGVFQNRRLTERASALLAEAGFEVLLADSVPANDAGLSYGQLVEAAVRQKDLAYA